MQLEACYLIGEIFGFASYRSLVYEADDIIGTIGDRFETQGQRTARMSRDRFKLFRDKDLAQLLVTDGDCLWISVQQAAFPVTY